MEFFKTICNPRNIADFDNSGCSKEAKDLMVRLLEKYPKKRLGTKGREELRKHKWFKGVPWKKIER